MDVDALFKETSEITSLIKFLFKIFTLLFRDFSSITVTLSLKVTVFFSLNFYLGVLCSYFEELYFS